MNVLFISTNLAETPYPVYPLGMGMVAAALTAAGHDVQQYDFLQHEASLEKLTAFVRETNPAIVGLSIRNIDNVNLINEHRYIDIVREIVSALRGVTSARIVLGGSGFSLMPEAILNRVRADYGIVGEGEALMTEFVREAAHNRFPATPILRSTPALTGNSMPPALYDRGIMEYYLRNGKTASVQTKRGCTHRCAYCSYPLLEGRELRCRDPEAVVDDMQRLVRDFGVELVFFTDSVFNDDSGHYRQVLDVLRQRKLRIPWVAFLKPEPFDDETLRLMTQTGLQAVELGADAATDTTLRGLHKSFTFADIADCTARFANLNIPVANYYMFGGPGETTDTVHEGIRNITGLHHAVSFMFMGIRILPGTPLEQIAVRDGLIRPDQDLLEPVYYLAPGIDQNWLQDTLTAGFKSHRRCIFPPDAFEKQVRLLHQLGHGGVLWDLLCQERRRERKPSAAVAKSARRAAAPRTTNAVTHSQ